MPTIGRSRGLTLVELMVAIAIGMLIIAAMAIIFANNSRTRTETERSSQKAENGRFALEQLTSELQHAGYFAEFDPTQLSAPAALPNPCATDLPALRSAMPLHVQGYHDVTASTLSCVSDVKPGTDILVIRRVSTCTVGSAGCTAPSAGAALFQASTCNDPAVPELASGTVSNFYKLETDATQLTLHKRNCTTVASTRRYLVRIYYVAKNDKPGDGIPTLKRAELGVGSGGALGFSSNSLVQGIENLQLEYGIDADGNGNPETYAADAGSVANWASVVSAKLHLLARNIDPTPGYTDSKVYTLGSTTVAAPEDAYKRSVFQEAVRLVNVSGRRF